VPALNAGPIFGLNLPPQQGDSFAANFFGPGAGAPTLDGSYNYEYTDQQLELVRTHFGGIRLGFNYYTALNATGVATIKHYFDVMRARGGVNILAMWDTIEPWEVCTPLQIHGNGRVNSIAEAIEAWQIMWDTFRDYDDVLFEVFNEPFGYWTVSGYLQEMREIIDGAGLPYDRVIVSGLATFPEVAGMIMGKSFLGWPKGDDPKSGTPHLAELSALGWHGAFAYHQYPVTLDPQHRSIDGYSQKLVRELEPVIKDHKIHFTEMGASLRRNQTVDPERGDVQSLLGFMDALRKLRDTGGDIASAHWWFGIGGDVDDAYNIFDPSSDRFLLVEQLGREINGNRSLQVA